MKKIILKKIETNGIQLTRDQLKKVFGGDPGGTTAPDPFTTLDPNDTCSGGHDFYPCYCDSPAGSFFAGCLATEASCNNICGN